MDETVKLTALQGCVESNTRRIETLERGQEALRRLATAVEVLAAKQEGMGVSVEKLNGKLDALEHRPLRRWESIADRLTVAALSVLIGWLMARIGVAG